MSLVFALKAAVNGPTGPRAILMNGLGRTKQRRRQSGQRPTPGFSRRTGGRAPRPETLMSDSLPTIPLVGASSVDQLRENLDAVDLELSDDQSARLDEAR